MGNSETGEVNDANRNLESEGLSGIDLSIEDNVLRVDGRATFFCAGKGTRKEPLIPIAHVNIKDALENAKDIAEFIEERDLKRTMFMRHNDTLLGVDGDTHVQLVRDKEKSEADWEWEVDFIKRILSDLKELEKDQKNSDRWYLEIVGQR